MDALFRLMFCALIIGMKIRTAQSTVYSSVDTALRFSQCLVERMSESQLFTARNRESMFEVKDIMTQSLLDTKQTNLSIKLFTIAFVSSLADVIVIEDTTENTKRKEIYSVALEQCSILSTGYIDADFINEAMQIFTVIEKNTAPKTEENNLSKGILTVETDGLLPNFQPSVYNPPQVQPPPARNPPTPEFVYSNFETFFETPQKPYSSPFAPSSQTGVDLKHQVDHSDEFIQSPDMKIKTGSFPSRDESFKENLAGYLWSSDMLKNFFCTGDKPNDKIRIFFTIIKSSLVEYGSKVSSLGATLVSSALSDWPKEGLCQNYAKTISDALAETLEESGIFNANAQSIANKITSNISQQSDAAVVLQSQRNTVIDPYTSTSMLQSSFGKDFIQSTQVLNMPPSTYSFSGDVHPNTQNGKSKVVSEENQDFKSPSSIAPSSSDQTTKSESQTKPVYPNSITFIDTISDSAITILMTFIETVISAFEKCTPVDDINKVTFAEYISNKFKEIHELYSKESD